MTSYNLIRVQMIQQLNMLTSADIVTVTQRMLFVRRVTSDGKCAFFVITQYHILISRHFVNIISWRQCFDSLGWVTRRVYGV